MTQKQKEKIQKFQAQTKALKKVIRGVEKLKRSKVSEQEKVQAERQLEKELKNL